MFKRFIAIFCLIMISTLSWGQESIEEEANSLFNSGKYRQAISMYNELENLGNSGELLYKRGRAFYHIGKYNQALTDLTTAFTLGKKTGDIYFYAGASLHKLGKYAEAAEFYKDYLAQVKDRDTRSNIIERIKRCGYANDRKYLAQNSYVENIGKPVNTDNDEINPIINPSNSSEYLFSSNRAESIGGLRNNDGFIDLEKGKYKFDIYKVKLHKGVWSVVEPIGGLVNTSKSEYLQGFTPNGKEIYYSKGFNDSDAPVYKEALNKSTDEIALPFKSPISGKNGDGNLQIYNDKYIFFSSNRPGGYGGYDLYCVEWQDSLWSKPKNLGPEINTVYNEVDPHLINDGKTLFYSADNTNTYGGYDIFTTQYDNISRTWSTPENVGLPLNSPGDDRYFKLNKDGQSALFSSDRAGSLGGFDVHMAYFKSRNKNQKIRPIQILDFMVEPVIDTTEQVIVDSGLYEEPVVNETKVEMQQVILEDIYYGNDENILNKKNLLVLNRLVKTLKQFPNAKVMISGNGLPEGIPEFDLYFSVKRAEKVAEYLQMKGIGAPRIYVSGHGYNYPRVKMTKENISTTAELNNRRIGLYIFPNGEPLVFQKDMPVVKDVLLDSKYSTFRNLIKGLSYKVVFTSVNQMYKGEVLSKYSDVNLEKRVDKNIYNYTNGIFKDYRSAKQRKNEMIRLGFTNAKITPYIDGIPLNYQGVFINAEKYLDLKNYMLFEEL